MKRVLEHLEGNFAILATQNEVFNFDPITGFEPILIEKVNKFGVDTSEGFFPISQVKAVTVNAIYPDIELIPSERSSGVCKCIEDPATDRFKCLIGEKVNISALVPTFLFEGEPVTVKEVGEGIVIVEDVQDGITLFVAISTCCVTRIKEAEM
ncbi:hypothetical protein [Bacillus sp. SM2101]|uniref:hypothetical protein n=1 Tax=Bacillus sp. SM2101 TaxID=2805366 RepID=UPI001BDDDB77|nr:hypothetical protein [Bacillus sp. SM2101]